MTHRSPARDTPLLDHCPPALPAWMYTDPAWHRREQDAVWRHNWLCTGRLSDLPAGTMRRLHLAGQNLILCRDRDGVLTAFHNTCRHRGSELCSTDEKRIGKLITCPYHAWSYDTSGRLVGTGPATPTADFRAEDHGLFPVHVTQWAGFVFVCLAQTPPRLMPDLGPTVLDNWPMEQLVTGHRLTKELACNWKIFWENYNECLHCPGLHPELCDMVPVYKRGIMAANEAPDFAPGTEVTGPLKPGARSWTMTGEACGPEFADLTDAERQAAYTFVTLYPTMFIVAHVDYVRAVTLTPLGPEKTRLTAEWLFAPETLAQPGFDPAEVAAFATLVLTQDAEAAEMNQRGLHAAPFRRGTLMPQEFDIARFHAWVLGHFPGETFEDHA